VAAAIETFASDGFEQSGFGGHTALRISQSHLEMPSIEAFSLMVIAHAFPATQEGR
jgi:hypothetical protein